MWVKGSWTSIYGGMQYVVVEREKTKKRRGIGVKKRRSCCGIFDDHIKRRRDKQILDNAIFISLQGAVPAALDRLADGSKGAAFHAGEVSRNA